MRIIDTIMSSILGGRPQPPPPQHSESAPPVTPTPARSSAAAVAPMPPTARPPEPAPPPTPTKEHKPAPSQAQPHGQSEAQPAATPTAAAPTAASGPDKPSAPSQPKPELAVQAKSPPPSQPAPRASQKPGQRPVDVAAVLDALSEETDEELNWRTSIVDLMKLLKLDSSLSARKTLAKELQYSGDVQNSAAMNMWLHEQVMAKLIEGGGKLPADVKH